MAEVTSSRVVGPAYFPLDLQVKRNEERRVSPEVAHTIRAAIDLAPGAREASERRAILFNLAAYEQYLAGELVDLEHSEEEIEKAITSIPD